jgi:SWI/SNF-related matrix-associated actin-dependent regulator 1 of chromatin subfamily A
VVNTSQLIPENVRHKLKPYQRRGVRLIYKYGKRVLLADDMGLGKTLQALTFVAMEEEHMPALIVCPASVKYNWQKEIDKWYPNYSEHVQIAQTQTPNVDKNLIIINYDILHHWKNELSEYIWKTVIFDECHKLKNLTSKRTKAAMDLVKNIRYVILMSGTPIENRPIDLYSSLHMIRPNEFHSRWKFGQRYCDLKHDGFGWNFQGRSNIDELHNKLKTVMIRRMKTDVEKQLPEKQIIPIYFNPTNLNEYNECRNNFTKWFSENHPIRYNVIMKKVKKSVDNKTPQELINLGSEESFDEMLWNESVMVEREKLLDKVQKIFRRRMVGAKLEYLKQLAYEGKKIMVFKWIEDFLETGQKLVLFAQHQKAIDEIHNRFKSNSNFINGTVPVSKRGEIVKRFQTKKEQKLLIGEISAMGTGVDGLQVASSTTAFVEFDWSPQKHTQAEDRVYRIGQNNSVTAFYFIADNTIDVEIVSLLDDKRQVANRILDGKAIEDLNIRKELMNRYL